MIHSIAKFIEIVAAIGAASGIAYNLLCVWSAIRFMETPRAAGDRSRSIQARPPVSILKPLKGIDPEMYECFRSHCLQDYPVYEIIFGVNDAGDPAATVVERLNKEFPEQEIRLFICKPDPGANTKVANLAQMVHSAKHEYLVVNDSDIRVSPEYLSRITSPLQDPTVGLVTCLYRGVAAPTTGSRLESLGISTDFSPGVLVARLLEGGIHFGLGSTLAFRRETLAAIGGFEGFVDYLADDYELGKRIADIGREIILSEEVVETFLPAYSLFGFLRHQMRWSRTIRDARYWGFAGLIFTFALPWAFLSLLCSKGAAWAWIVFVLAALARIGVAASAGVRVLNDQKVLRWLWVIPLRDLLASFIWFASFLGHTIEWRGEKFRLQRGKLVRT